MYFKNFLGRKNTKSVGKLYRFFLIYFTCLKPTEKCVIIHQNRNGTNFRFNAKFVPNYPISFNFNKLQSDICNDLSPEYITLHCSVVADDKLAQYRKPLVKSDENVFPDLISYANCLPPTVFIKSISCPLLSRQNVRPDSSHHLCFLQNNGQLFYCKTFILESFTNNRQTIPTARLLFAL